MPQVLQVGPVVFPLSVLALLAALVVVAQVVQRAGEARGQVEMILWQAFVVGLVTSRAAFVLQYGSSYAAQPWSVLDIRDGGWRPVAGFAAGWLFVAVRLLTRKSLRRPVLGAALAGTVIWGAGLLALALHAGRVQALPSLALQALDGSPADLARFRGKPLVVNLWATWCPPCVREMPVLHRAQADHPAVHFVFINQGETAQRVAPWLSARGLALRNVLLDPKGDALAVLGQRGLPTTLFFNAEGELIAARTGELSEATLREKLDSVAAARRITAP